MINKEIKSPFLPTKQEETRDYIFICCIELIYFIIFLKFFALAISLKRHYQHSFLSYCISALLKSKHFFLRHPQGWTWFNYKERNQQKYFWHRKFALCQSIIYSWSHILKSVCICVYIYILLSEHIVYYIPTVNSI